MRRTKIVCTIGPASSDRDTLRKMIDEGMDVARMNFSHGTHESHAATYENLRAVAAEAGKPLAVLMDLQGPKIRTGRLAGGGMVELEEGKPLVVTTEDIEGGPGRISTTYNALAQDVKEGDNILLADGLMCLRVEAVRPPEVHCTVLIGGMLGEHKGMNLPRISVSAPSLTEKDIADLEFGLQLGVDFVALSFVRKPEDIAAVRRRIDSNGNPAQIVAKIERPEAIENFDAILAETDCVMVARGDLGVETAMANVPQLQKELIRKCNWTGKPVITATQMLESMTTHPRPTRAEVSDVANAIYDGTDAVMLSGETAAGQYPVKTVRVMASIAASADEATRHVHRRARRERLLDDVTKGDNFVDAIGQAAARMTHLLDVARIVCITNSGGTAQALSRYRPPVPIEAFTADARVERQCSLVWGVTPHYLEHADSIEDMVRTVEQRLMDSGHAQQGSVVIIVTGLPMHLAGQTNLLKLHRVGDPF